MLKRSFDLIASSIGIVVLSPLIILVGLAVLVESGWPIFYRAERTGLHGVPFRILKFRSMRDAPTGSHSHHSGDDDPRVTTVGKWVRKFKLDELPQLWNVAKGDMSFVGPRPETPDYIKHYTPDQMAILELRPGITDFASIEFADLGSLLKGDDPDKLYFEKVWDRKMELRMKYVRQRSFWVDIKLIFLTFAAIFNRKYPEHISRT